MLDTIKNLLEAKWFHGDVSRYVFHTSTSSIGMLMVFPCCHREEAQRRLHDKEHGTFLVRFNSSIPGAFTLDKVSDLTLPILHRPAINGTPPPQVTPQRTILSARIFQNEQGQFHPENDPKSCYPDLPTFVEEVRRNTGCE